VEIKTIRQLREERGWSQFELAGRIGVTPSAIYNWERGRNEPRLSQLRALAREFGVLMDNIAMTEADKDALEKIAA
jgi:transcriptional regulator with XRE-family HTH domain